MRAQASSARAVRCRLEERDVGLDRAGEELVVLEHGREAAAVLQHVPLHEGHAADAHFSCRRRQQAQQDLQQRRLAATGGSRDGQAVARGDAEMHVLQYPRLVVAVAERDAHRLDRRVAAVRRQGAARDVVLARFERDVGQPGPVQVEHAELDPLVDQGADPVRERGAIRDEGEQHPDGEEAIHDRRRAQADDQQVLAARDKRLGRCGPRSSSAPPPSRGWSRRPWRSSSGPAGPPRG